MVILFVALLFGYLRLACSCHELLDLGLYCRLPRFLLELPGADGLHRRSELPQVVGKCRNIRHWARHLPSRQAPSSGGLRALAVHADGDRQQQQKQWRGSGGARQPQYIHQSDEAAWLNFACYSCMFPYIILL